MNAKPKCCNAKPEVESREIRYVRWRIESAAAIDIWNSFIEKEGLPLARHHQF
jgi:post-segregation antitoxin (ccd killing protein)